MTGAVTADVTTTRTALRRNFWRGVWRVMRRKPSRLLGVVLMLGFIVMASVGPVLYGRPVRDAANTFQSPRLAHPPGTAFQGADFFHHPFCGTRDALMDVLH